MASLDGQDRAGGGEVGLVADVAYRVRRISEATLGPSRVQQQRLTGSSEVSRNANVLDDLGEGEEVGHVGVRDCGMEIVG